MKSGEINILPMKKIAKIYLPTKSATQSGYSKEKFWLLEFESKKKEEYKDSLMGWNASQNTSKQVLLKFKSSKAAVCYAEKHNIAYKLLPQMQHTRKKKAYADNFIK